MANYTDDEIYQMLDSGKSYSQLQVEYNIGGGTLTRYKRKRELKKEMGQEFTPPHSPNNEGRIISVAPCRKKSITLVIPDLHCPYEHPDALAFLKAVKDKFCPTNYVCLGDEIDAMGFSKYPRDPDSINPGKELAEAIEHFIPFYREFPNMLVCESNHTVRPWKQAFLAGLPAAFLPSIATALNAPDGWVWANRHEVDGVIFIHGDPYGGAQAHMKWMRAFKQSVAIGHIHGHAGVNYEGELFGMNTGCLIDQKAICFKYAKNMPIPVNLGCGLIMGGKSAYFIPMILDENQRWIGVL